MQSRRENWFGDICFIQLICFVDRQFHKQMDLNLVVKVSLFNSSYAAVYIIYVCQWTTMVKYPRTKETDVYRPK